MEEKKEQEVTKLVDTIITSVANYIKEHINEMLDDIVTDDVEECMENVEEVFGCEIFSGNVNEEFNEMFPRILIDCLEKYYIQ